MTVRRFVLPPEALVGDEVVLTGELYRYAIRVLRLGPGSPVLLSDGRGREWQGRIETVERLRAVVAIYDKTAATATAAGPRITLYQGLPKGEKLDLILQKGTELGAAAIIPFMGERSVVRIPPDRAGERIERWQRIVREASRQSQRTAVPEVDFAPDLARVLSTAGQTVKLLLWEEEKTTRLRETLAALPAPESVAVLVGPEGGFSGAEAQAAQAGGFIPVSLGSRVLRTETAGLAMLAILQFYWGDMG
jgi:16S rRNA (uracil1498-N3)-methyltransferase